MDANDILEEWSNATKMRKWYSDLKNTVAEEVKDEYKEQADAEGWSESEEEQRRDEEEERRLKQAVADITNKAEFLVRLQTPSIFKSLNPDRTEHV